MSEQEELVVTLVDENDEEFDAILEDSIQYDGHIYNLLIPADQKDAEEPEVIILEYKEENGDVLLLPVENEVLLDEIWAAYQEEADGEGEE